MGDQLLAQIEAAGKELDGALQYGQNRSPFDLAQAYALIGVAKAARELLLNHPGKDQLAVHQALEVLGERLPTARLEVVDFHF